MRARDLPSVMKSKQQAHMREHDPMPGPPPDSRPDGHRDHDQQI